ncbi:hypothetical protein [Panacibacter ginsenosidivorans]|uniref:hypothetical protein n=1 Tax=Panacibacter ginsenosidivorans TaxID=1813871 RepID=UPI0013156808|nr:hypothetical protein [Panacibacter ginsenosidivorans]
MSNLTYISPSFIVASLKTSVSFYIEKLGFEIRYIGQMETFFLRNVSAGTLRLASIPN